MSKIEELLKESIFNAPLTLLNFKEESAISFIDSHLPYSTGFEIECNKKESFNIDDFRSIPDIIAVDVDCGEQRFRIPPGLKGFVCLYRISEALIKNSDLNLESGIHYHVDATDWIKDLDKYPLAETNKDWITKELDSWNYKGTYNQRTVSHGSHTWLRFSHHDTLEFRIGEMTFDYHVLAKRIVHANSITRKLKNLSVTSAIDKLLYKNKMLQEELKEKIDSTPEQINMDEFIKRRLK